MRIAIWMLVAVVMGLALLPSSAAAPSTRPVMTATLMARNLGPLGRLVEADAKARPGRYRWLSGEPASVRAGTLKDFDSWSVIVVEVVQPELRECFSDGWDPWVTLRRTGPANPDGTLTLNSTQREIVKPAGPGAEATDRVDITYSWQGNGGHKVLNSAVFCDDVLVSLHKSDLRPIRGESVELEFTGDAIDLSALPKRLPDAAGRAAPLLSKDVAHLVVRQRTPDTAPVPYTADLDGVVEATAGDTHIVLSIEKMAAELDGESRHVTGFLRIEITTGGSEPVEQDLMYDITFTLGPDSKPIGGKVRWTWPAGTLGDAEAATRPTSAPT